MIRILDIAQKDLLQILRDRKTFMFLLIMPIAFTLFFSIAFGGAGQSNSDARLPVGFLDQDQSALSGELATVLAGSTVIRLDQNAQRVPADLDKLVADEKMAAAVIIPVGYGQSILDGTLLKLTAIADPSKPATPTVQNEILIGGERLTSAARIAQIAAQTAQDPSAFDPALAAALAAWQNPPIRLDRTASVAVKVQSPNAMSAAHSSPGMMLQFAIAGLITAATILVTERKSRSLQRLLTTATSRVHILVGHYLAMFALIFAQFVVLMLFGKIFLGVDYLRVPAATLLVAAAAAACISALGLLIGVFARSEEQTIVLVMIPMFVLSGLGGAWMPLEYTGPTFQTIGHASPIAWAMDGFQNIVIRGLGFNSVLIPAAVLMGYALLFFALAVWRFWSAEEK
ncbi:MAG: ABC transporter permease [Anaerolineales bacterium]|jgi:ABC-2 type transport system permease protein